MPLVYRSMVADGESPLVADKAIALGVRAGSAEGRSDIPVDEAGNVRPRTGGMSVAPSKESLPPHRIPRSLAKDFPGAVGRNDLVCWRTGDGGFESGPLADGLQFRPDPKASDRHGFVEPDREMSLDDFRSFLAATRESWVSEDWTRADGSEES